MLDFKLQRRIWSFDERFNSFFESIIHFENEKMNQNDENLPNLLL
jgi:hypothetical protein